MRLIAVTPTFGRPEALALCKHWMSRQTRKPDKHVIVEGGHLWDNLLKVDIKNVDAIAIIEDDDYYAPTYLEWVETQLRWVTVTGKANGHMYHMPGGAACIREHPGRSSLSGTAMHAQHWRLISNACFKNAASIDSEFWQHMRLVPQTLTTAPIMLSIKGMPSPRYYTTKHGEKKFRSTSKNLADWWSDDKDRKVLRKWLDNDEAFELYRPFFNKVSR